MSNSIKEARRERTLVILKPDAVERELIGKIIACFEAQELKVVGFKMLQATPELLDGHFPHSDEWIVQMGERAIRRVRKEMGKEPNECFGTDDPFKIGSTIANGCREYYLSGPLIALVLWGNNAVLNTRSIIGNTLPSKAEKGTVRGDFGIPEDEKALFGGAARNLVHASDSAAEAKREITCWFTPEEIFEP